LQTRHGKALSVDYMHSEPHYGRHVVSLAWGNPVVPAAGVGQQGQMARHMNREAS
jgi:hypothetical protein